MAMGLCIRSVSTAFPIVGLFGMMSTAICPAICPAMAMAHHFACLVVEVGFREAVLHAVRMNKRDDIGQVIAGK